MTKVDEVHQIRIDVLNLSGVGRNVAEGLRENFELLKTREGR